MYHTFFIHSSGDGHLACFHVLAIVNSAVIASGLKWSSSSLKSCSVTPCLTLDWLIYSFDNYLLSVFCVPVRVCVVGNIVVIEANKRPAPDIWQFCEGKQAVADEQGNGQEHFRDQAQLSIPDCEHSRLPCSHLTCQPWVPKSIVFCP